MAEKDEQAKTSEVAEGPSIPVVTSALEVPVIFTDSLYHITWSESVARLAFLQYLGDPPTDPAADAQALKARHVVTLALPFDGLLRMSEYLQTSIELLRESGVVK